MIEAKVNISGSKKDIFISQMNGGFDEIAKDLVTILDRILIDELIKISPTKLKLSAGEKEKIILDARKEILYKMGKLSFFEGEYIDSSETSLYLAQKYGM